MRRLLLAAALAIAPAVAHAEDMAVKVVEEADGTRTLAHEIVLDAPAARVWQAFSTEAGWRSWAVPFVKMDWRLGGTIETSYDPSAKAGNPANIKQRILAIVPGRILAFQTVQAPPGFPSPEILPTLWSVVEIEAVTPERTRVRLNGMGYARTPAHDALFGFFKGGNATALRMLKQSLTDGPVDWSKPMGGKGK